MSAELDEVLAVYVRPDGGRTCAHVLEDLRRGNFTNLRHAAYMVATADAHDERGMPTRTWPEQLAAQRALLERVLPEIEAMEVEAGAHLEAAEHA